MRLITTLSSIATIASGNRAPRASDPAPSIINPISGIRTVLQDAGIDISNHGTNCARMGGSHEGPGAEIDELDKICKEWINKRSCIKKTGGDCAGDSSEFYVAQNPSACSSGSDACETMACDIDQLYLAEVQAYMNANPAWTATSVPAGSGSGGSGDVKDSCCGSSADALEAYSSATYSCVNDQVKIPGPEDCTGDEAWDAASKSCSTTLNEILNGGNEWVKNSLGYYVHVSDNKMNYDEAQTYCQGLGQGAEMAMPANDAENDEFFRNILAKTNRRSGDFGWWGFKRFTASDTRTWNGADMRPMNWSKWCRGEPNNWNNEERCSMTWSTNPSNPCWNDISCRNNYRAICVYYA